MARTYSSDYRQSKRELSEDHIINQLNIRYRVCRVFTPKKRNDESNLEDSTICECGFEKSNHVDATSGDWNMPNNTLEQVDPLYGHLQENNAAFVRLALDTPPNKVETILLEAWKIHKPRLIASIIGGAKFFKLSDRLEANFINGIIDIAQKSDVWLFTNGYNVGLTHLVGQAIHKVKLTNQDKKITAIGVSKWGSIMNVESLTARKQDNIQTPATDVVNQQRKRRLSGEWPLEMNHSHYLMLDDGTVRYFDTKRFRTQLATHIARLPDVDDVYVPVVTIVAEGGKDTIANVYYDLEQSVPVPIILVEGSGRAADFLCRWLLYTKDLENDNEDLENQMQYQEPFGINELHKMSEEKVTKQDKRNSKSNTDISTRLDSNKTRLEKMFEKYRQQLEVDLEKTIFPNIGKKKNEGNNEKDLTLKRIMYCLQPAVRCHINIFSLNSDDSLSETIIRSICKSRDQLLKRKDSENFFISINKRTLQLQHTPKWTRIEKESRFSIRKKAQNAERTKLLKLAMDWNCIDVAKEFIFQNSLNNILDKTQMFEIAIQKDLPTFVDEFLRLGIDINEVFYSKMDFSSKDDRYKKFIRSLYKDEFVNHKKTHLKYFVKSDPAVNKKHIQNVESLNLVFRTLIGDYMQQLYFNTFEEEMTYRIKYGLMKAPEESFDDVKQELMPAHLVRDYLMRDLFLWSILMNYVDMAKVLLSHMKYRICPALIATKIFKQYHEIATYSDLKKGYLKSVEYFEQYAIDCLDKCDDQDVDLASEIILQQNKLYGYVTCLQVASDAGDKSFIAQPCSVHAVNNVWYDKLNPEQTTIGRQISLLVGYVSLGLAAPIVVPYRKNKQEKQSAETSQRRLKKNGINYCDSALLEYITPRPSDSIYKRYFRKLKKFHRALPTKFFYHLINYLFFLLLFSYVLLFDFEPPTNQIPSIHWTEILTIILVSCMLIEEIHYFFSQDNSSLIGKFENYFVKLFKLMTFAGFLLFYIGLIVRFTYASSEIDFTAARIIMAFDLEIWWLRLLSFIIVIPFLGPHLVAIGKMLKDLMFFTLLIAIVMTGYGVSSRSMVYYPKANNFTTETGGFIDTSFDGRSVMYQIFYPVYYMMYGEFGTELDNLNTNRNAAWSIATHVILAVHMMFVNILLINLLIAIFSKRFEEVYEDTQKIWHSQRYILTREYYSRSPLFPPFSLIYDVYHLCRMLFFSIRRICSRNAPADYYTKVFRMISKNDDLMKEWCKFEEETTHEYAHNEVKALRNTSTKSTSESSVNNKEKQKKIDENINDDNNNNTVYSLKQIEDNLINLNGMIEKMRKDLQEKKQ